MVNIDNENGESMRKEWSLGETIILLRGRCKKEMIINIEYKNYLIVVSKSMLVQVYQWKIGKNDKISIPITAHRHKIQTSTQ